MTATLVSRPAVTWRDAAPVLVLAGAALLAMLLWGASPAARYMQHGSTVHHGLGHHGTAFPSGPAVVAGLSAAWLLMTVVTMLPTAVPLLTAVPQSKTTAAAGFLAVWLAFGFAVALLDVQLQRLVSPSAAPSVLAATLALAGCYQLSGLAGRCLTACRQPFSFVARHWTGRADVGRQAFAIGRDYGVSCLGCCAGLMVVMFALGLGNPAWMLLFALVGSAQKLASWGEVLTVPLGIGLLAGALLLATTPTLA